MGPRHLFVDGLLLAAYLLTANPQVTGFSVHEWLGLGLAIVVVAHVAGSVVWAGDLARRGVRRRSAAQLGRLALDAATAVAFVVCVVSGIMESGEVLPTFGLYAGGYYLWNPLHATSAKVLLALVLVHVVVHWPMVAAGVARVRDRRGAGKDTREDSPEDAGA